MDQNFKNKPHLFQSGLNVYAKYGVGIFERKTEPTYSVFKTKLKRGTGMSMSAGVDYQFYLRNKGNLNLGLGYEFSQTKSSNCSIA